MSIRLEVKRMFDQDDSPVKGQSFIYHLINKGQVVYVGQSANLQERIYSHMTDGKDFDSFSYYPCDPDEINIKEALDIVKHNPKLNNSLPKTDLFITMPHFKRELSKALHSVISEHFDFDTCAFKRPSVKKRSYTYFSVKSLDAIKEKASMIARELFKESNND